MTERKLPKSPQRYTFQKEQYLKRTDKSSINQDYLDFFNKLQTERDNKENDIDWQKNNLEYDLRTCEIICRKVKESESYAQNLYAALCNTEYQKLDVLHILKEETWGCSWRYAGGIIADIRGEGDYIDWYCSGIGTKNSDNDITREFVGEGTVTEEILNDIKNLGWILVDRN